MSHSLLIAPLSTVEDFHDPEVKISIRGAHTNVRTDGTAGPRTVKFEVSDGFMDEPIILDVPLDQACEFAELLLLLVKQAEVAPTPERAPDERGEQ